MYIHGDLPSMSVPDELRRYVPRTDLYDSYDLIHYHMPVEQPPATASYIIFRKGNKIYAKNGVYGHIEFEDTDPTSVIQNAANSLGETGGKILIRNGTYLINDTILLSKKTIIEGESEDAILKAGSGLAEDAYILDLNETAETLIGHVNIKTLRIDCNGTANGINLTNITASYLEDIVIANIKTTGILVDYNGTKPPTAAKTPGGIYILNSRFSPASGQNPTAISINYSTQNWISSCWFVSNFGICIKIYDSNKIRIMGNEMNYWTDTAISLDSDGNPETKETIIVGNWMVSGANSAVKGVEEISNTDRTLVACNIIRTYTSGNEVILTGTNSLDANNIKS